MKPDAECVCHRPGDTRLSRAYRGTLLSERGRGWRCSDRPQCPVRTISAGIVTGEQSIDTFGTLSVSRETCWRTFRIPRRGMGFYSSFVRGTACFERKTLPPSSMCFECNARQTMLPTGSQVWTSLRRQGRRHIGKRGTHAQRSAIMFHVKPGADRTHWPIQHV